MDSQLVLLLSVAVLSALVALVLYFLKKSEKKEHENDGMSKSEIAELKTEYSKLKSLFIGLIKKIESMAVVDRDVDSQVKALQALAGVNREQLKYLTSNVNKSNTTT